MLKVIGLLSSVILLLPACTQQKSSASGLAALEIGMTKSQVRKCMQNPGRSRGCISLADGSVVETIAYDVRREIQGCQHAAHAILTVCFLGLWAPIWVADALEGTTEVFWMTFKDGKLTHYGHPKDFQAPSDHIQEYRIR